MKYIVILGSTGSIGTQALDVIRNRNDIKVYALTAKNNIELLEQQIREFMPEVVCVYDEENANKLKLNISDLSVKVLCGMEGLLEVTTKEKVSLVITALVGMIGIRPTIEAIKAGKDIALANKETLVTAGHIIMPLAIKMGVKILPVDSEHSAIFQCLNGEIGNKINKILLTASGGPFRTWTKEQIENATLENALKHPNWSMGQKITIDSATMINKGLEVIEAKWLFGVDIDSVEVVVHPQSIIHSMVEFDDGSIMAQLGTPDMRLPIQYAITYPLREFRSGNRLDFGTLSKLDFEKPDFEKFLGLKLAYEAGRIGGNMPTIFNAANEKAVAKFLNREIKFIEISQIVEKSMQNHKFIENPNIAEILEVEQSVYDFIESGC